MYSDLCHRWPPVTKEVSQVLGCDKNGVTSKYLWHLFGHRWPSVTQVTAHVTIFTVVYWRAHWTMNTLKGSNHKVFFGNRDFVPTRLIPPHPQCSQFFRQAHFCKKTGAFWTKIRAHRRTKLKFCDFIVFLRFSARSEHSWPVCQTAQ